MFGISIPQSTKPQDEHCVVWDENWESVSMFLRMQTQWTVSMAGYTGLRYEVLVCSGGLFDLYDVEDRRTMLDDIQVMEIAALNELHKDQGGKQRG